jgi:hypothetical protein
MSKLQLNVDVQKILQFYSQKPSVRIPKPPVPAKKPSPPRPPPIPKGLVKALLIGINYLPFPELKLYGCINDVTNIRSVLQRFYPNCKDVRILTDQTAMKPTKQNILSSIQWLVKDLKPGQSVYLHYSGHGTRVMDTNGDERSGADSCICPYDGSQFQIITDDELRSFLVNKIPQGSKCFTVLDCCNSGTALDLRYTWKSIGPGKLSFDQDNSYQKTAGNVIFLSGCRDDQYAMDTVDAFGKGSGALTNALIYTWNTYRTNLKLKHLLWDVRQYLQTNNYEQVPQISTGTAISSEASLDLNQAN